MPKRNRRPSLMSGVLWLILGGMLLLNNFGVGPDFWELTRRYWPILLILIGLGKVIDYYRQKDGVSLRFGEVFGLLFLLLMGSFFVRVARGPMRNAISSFPLIHLGGDAIDVADFLGTSFTVTEEAAYPIAKPMPVRIENAYGSIQVSPGSDGELRVRLRKVVYNDQEARAKEIANEIQLQGGNDSGTFLIKTNRDTLASKDYRFRTEMEVFVPKKVTLQVQNQRGEVRVTNLEGKLDLNTFNKPLEVRDCAGEIKATNRYAESRFINLSGNLNVDARGRIYIETVRGDVDARGESAPIEIIDVTGKVSITCTEGSVNVRKVSKPVIIDARGSQVKVSDLADKLNVTSSHRSVSIADVAGDVWLDTRYSTVSLKGIKGNVEATSQTDRLTADDLFGRLKLAGQGTAVRANNVAGDVDIETSRRNVVVNDFGGGCKVTNEYSDVTLSSSNLLKGDITVKNRNGGIEVFLPEDAAFQIEGIARFGRVVSNFPGLETTEKNHDTSTLKGKVRANGPMLRLETDYSNISVRTRGSEHRVKPERTI